MASANCGDPRWRAQWERRGAAAASAAQRALGGRRGSGTSVCLSGREKIKGEII